MIANLGSREPREEPQARRYLTLLAVAMLHLVVLAILLATSPSPRPPAAKVESVQLLFLPPVHLPQVHATLERPRRLIAATPIALAPPALDSLSSLVSQPPAASAGGSGSGVDWRAEARRALNAFEIRSGQPSANESVSHSAEDSWWPQAHHAGEQYKTAGGDWIVWIDANCYRVASANPSAYARGASLAPTICRGPPETSAR